MLTKKKAANTAPTVPTLPDWQQDRTVLAIRAKIAELAAQLAEVRATLPQLQTQEAELQRGLSQGAVLRSLGVTDTDPAADVRDQQLTAEIQATVRQQVSTQAALEQTERELEAAQAMQPRIEAAARKRVMQAQRDIYMEAADRFTAAIEQASREQEVLYALHGSIQQQFPMAFETIEGEGVITALGLPAPLFVEIRPPQALNGSPWVSKLHRWRMSLASFRGIRNPLDTSDA